MDDDEPVKETNEELDVLLSIGWRRLLVVIRAKMDTVELLCRSQLISLYTTLFTVLRVFESEEEQVGEDLRGDHQVGC